MKELHDFFAASVGAAAAFIGLLFVAISVAPERVFGEGADARKNGRALGAFTALVNVFLISLFALKPDTSPATFAIVAVVTMVLSIRSGYRSYLRDRNLRHWRSWGLISVSIYGLEIVFALRTSIETNSLVDIVIGLYIFALITAWTLLDISDRKPDAGETQESPAPHSP